MTAALKENALFFLGSILLAGLVAGAQILQQEPLDKTQAAATPSTHIIISDVQSTTTTSRTTARPSTSPTLKTTAVPAVQRTQSEAGDDDD